VRIKDAAWVIDKARRVARVEAEMQVADRLHKRIVALLGDCPDVGDDALCWQLAAVALGE
jgi:hypothetical protein